MDDKHLKKVLLDYCHTYIVDRYNLHTDINGVLSSNLTGDNVMKVFKQGMLTCAFCGHMSETKEQHKQHLTQEKECTNQSHSVRPAQGTLTDSPRT